MRLIRHQLIFFALFALYIITRLISISDIEFTFWQSIWVFTVKNSFLLITFIYLTYSILNSIRHQSRTGPQIISGKNLKKTFYPMLLLSWLAVIVHTVFEIFKLLLPFKLLPFYQFSDFMDETIAHIFMYVPWIVMVFIITILEIERPFSVNLKKKELTLLGFLGAIIGLLWGLNLTEGRLSLVTSFPVMIIYLIIISRLFVKHRLEVSNRPWNLFAFIAILTGSISFATWSLVYQSIPEFFTTLK